MAADNWEHDRTMSHCQADTEWIEQTRRVWQPTTHYTSKFAGRKVTLRIKCRCGDLHIAHIERRIGKRKNTNRRGYFIFKTNENLAGAIMVKNISANGAGFTVLGDQNFLEKNDWLTLGIGIIKAPSHIIEKDAFEMSTEY